MSPVEKLRYLSQSITILVQDDNLHARPNSCCELISLGQTSVDKNNFARTGDSPVNVRIINRPLISIQLIFAKETFKSNSR